ncbi:MAG: cytoskeleton protein RodZ [Thermodesulfobacteriota bacterium]|nr:cytoskeleton protein RodZ [Thermodesulfobacteriota bacterium]
MKSSESLSGEIPAVNKEPEVIDLKGLREAKGLTLRDIFSVTRITVTNLEAIEAGHYDLLPAPVYARTFIKTYAGILGTASKPILQQYENYLKSRDEIQEGQQEEHKELSRKEKKAHNVRFLLWIVAATMLCGLIVSILLIYVKDVADLSSVPQLGSPKSASSPVPAPTPNPALAPTNAPNVPPAAPAGPAPSAVNQPWQTPAHQGVGGQQQEPPLNLKIAAVEKTWLRISADGKEPEQIMLTKGDRIERMAGEAFIVDIGNAGGILVTFQNKPLPPLGKRGEVIHLKFP